MIGLTADKVAILLILAAFLIGPSRIPTAAAWLGRTVRAVRDLADGAKERARQELGDDFDAIDWQKLDPRRYDPRRIIADALTETPRPTGSVLTLATADLERATAAWGEGESSTPTEPEVARPTRVAMKTTQAE